jgi:hypothetical protein
MPPSSSSLHGFLAHTKGASVVSTRAEKTRQVRVSPPQILGQENSSSAIAAREAHERQLRANKVVAKTPSPQSEELQDEPSAKTEGPKSRARKGKSIPKQEIESPDVPTEHKGVRPKMSINFELPIGIITNLVNDVRVSENILSVWGPSGATDRFRPAADTELVVSFNGGRYNCWSPGIYIDNPNYECSVTVFIIKDE